MNLFGKIRVGARPSALSKAQVHEVLTELKTWNPDIDFEPVWVETMGDLDLITPLKSLGKSDFFTRQIDEQLLRGEFQIAIHSAKDLPEPLAQGLEVVAITQGVACSDVIVVSNPDRFLPMGARIGTSSLRREHNVKAWRPDLVCVDIRGSIEQRLHQLDFNLYDGIVMAESALIRLQLTHRHQIHLPGERAALQGQLAIIALVGDEKLRALFTKIDTRGSKGL